MIGFAATAAVQDSVGGVPRSDGGKPASPPPANGHKTNGGAAAAEGTEGATARSGVAPGSFLDLLMRASDRTTGRGFTDMEIANQVPAPAFSRLNLKGETKPIMLNSE